MRERKRHTARHVASARYTNLSQGGYPIPCPGGTLSQVCGGYPIPGLGGSPHPRSGGGYPIPCLGGVSAQSRPGMGYPQPDLGWGTTPARPGMGYPPARPGMGYPPARPGMGYPALDLRSWDGVPPPTSVDRYTDWCQNITFPRTTYAGGKYTVFCNAEGFLGTLMSSFVKLLTRSVFILATVGPREVTPIGICNIQLMPLPLQWDLTAHYFGTSGIKMLVLVSITLNATWYNWNKDILGNQRIKNVGSLLKMTTNRVFGKLTWTKLVKFYVYYNYIIIYHLFPMQYLNDRPYNNIKSALWKQSIIS